MWNDLRVARPRFFGGGERGYRLPALHAVVIVAFGFSMLLIGLGRSRVLTYHETIFAQSAREMVATGEWILPRFAGHANLHKPPLTHWLVAGTMKAFDGEAEWICRLPSVVAAVALALSIAAIAARWFGTRVGFVTGLVQLTTFYGLMQARLAEADMLLAAFVGGALCCFAAGALSGPRLANRGRWLRWCFFGLCGLAFLTKGPLGPVLVGVVVVPYLVWQHDRAAVRFLASPIGWLVLSVCVVAWPWAAYRADPAVVDAWLFHNVERFHGDLGGGKPPLFYLYTIPALLVPWTPFAIVRLIKAARSGEFSTPIGRFFLLWVLMPTLLFSVAAFKHKHYIIPAMPPLSIAAAMGLCDFVRWCSRRLAHVRSYWPAAMVTALTVSLAFAGWHLAGKAPGGVAALYVIWGTGVLGFLYVRARRPITARLGIVFATTWVCAVAVQTLVMPSHDSYREQTLLAQRTMNHVPEDQAIHLLALPENQITFYLKREIVRIDGVEESAKFCKLRGADPWYALAPSFVVARLSEASDVEVVDRCATINDYLSESERILLVRVDGVRSTAERTASATVPLR